MFSNAQIKRGGNGFSRGVNGPPDASLECFKALYKYNGRIVLSVRGSRPAPAIEAAFLCQILFIQFMSQRAPALLPHGTARLSPAAFAPNTFYRDSLKPLLAQSLPTFENDPLEIDSRLLYELVESFAKYTWGMEGASVRPWLLGYVYERWINRRESGAYFTPDALAFNIVQLALCEWLVTQAELELGSGAAIQDALEQDGLVSTPMRAWLQSKISAVRIVDLSMGGGAFLVAAARALIELRAKFVAVGTSGAHLLEHIFRTNLCGMDIAAEARQVAQLRLWLLALELNALDDSFHLPPLPHLHIGDALAFSPTPANFAQLRLLKEGSAAAPTTQVAEYDVCVGNPPFIALSQKSAVSNKARLVKQWNTAHPQYAITPTIDLSNFFILRGVERLSPNGVLAYITSRNFFDTRYGAPIRRYLTEQVDLRNIITLHDHPFTQLGVKVKANTVILSLIKRAPQTALQFQHLTFWDEPLPRVDGNSIARAVLQTSNNWTNTLFAQPLRVELKARMTRTVGDYARVKMGIKSGCNSFFLLRTDSDAYRKLASTTNILAPVIKNSREIEGFILPQESPYRFLNLYEQVNGLETGFDGKRFNNPVAASIYARGIQYPCALCQERAAHEHQTHPERFPHRGMCEHCEHCEQNGACDRPVDRESTQGHRPAWYTLALGKPPLVAVQCIVDTEIGVFLNSNGVYVTDQFQVIDAPENPELGLMLFLYLQSRVSHFLLEGMGLHRARYDGSFMLKIQVEHLRALPCPGLQTIDSRHKKRLQDILNKLTALPQRKAQETQLLRDELDQLFLGLLGFSQAEILDLQPKLRESLEQAILFRWVKTRTRLAALNSNIKGTDHGN